MEGRRICNILEAVARKEGVSLAEVVFEIESAISVAYQNAKLSNDQAVIKMWNEIPCKGGVPTAVELIDYLTNRVFEVKENHLGLQDVQIKDDRKGRPYAGPRS